MTDTTNPSVMLDTLESIHVNMNRLVGLITPEQRHLPTPCAEWDVHALVNHVTGTCNVLAAGARREVPTKMPDDDHTGDNPPQALADATAANLAAWRTEGALEGMMSLPAEMPAIAVLGVNIMDTGIHCWDLATAIGADHGLSTQDIAVIDAWSRDVISDDFRGEGKGFAAAVPSSSSESLPTLLGFTGRSVRSIPPGEVGCVDGAVDHQPASPD